MKRPLLSLPIYDEAKCFFFALGRNAMYAACAMLGLKQGDEVLTPAFDCDGSLQPFRVLGHALSFYRSDPYTFSVDVDDVRRRISRKTKLLHIINHFGMPQPWDALLALRRETGIPILEDNAYSLFSSLGGRPFGTFGDVSVFSLRKNLPLVDGGLLRVNNPRYQAHFIDREAPWIHSTEWGPLMRSAKALFGYGRLAKALRRVMRMMDPAAEPPPPLYSDARMGWPAWPPRDAIGADFSCDYMRPMSRLARMQLGRFSLTDYQAIGEAKRRHYAYLAAALKGLRGVRVLWPELPKGTVPFCLSCLIDSKRDLIFSALRKGYDVMAWPTLPGAVLEALNEFPEVESLGRQIVQINLPSDRVRSGRFARYLEDLLRDIRNAVERYGI